MNPPNQQSGPPQPLCRAPRALCPLCPCLLLLVKLSLALGTAFSLQAFSLFFLPLRAQTPGTPPASASATPDASLTAATERLQQQLKPAKHPASDNFSFTLLPVGFAPNPQIDYIIVTEMTNAGRKLPEPSVDKPVYYISHSVDQKDIGDPYGLTKDVPYDNLRKHLLAALAANGYRPCDPEHPENTPTQIFFFSWGMHNRIVGTGNDDDDKPSDEIQNILARAKTVGGQKFADEFAKALAEQLAVEKMVHMLLGPPYPLCIDSPHGATWRAFAERDETTQTLVYETMHDCYYLIVTAYDLESLKSHQRKLLWVTRISTVARGVNFEQTLPIMINNGAYFFGRETPPEILRKRAYKRATVDIGDAQVVEYMTGTTHATGTAAPTTSGTTTGKP